MHLSHSVASIQYQKASMYIENNILMTLQASDDGTLDLGLIGFWT